MSLIGNTPILALTASEGGLTFRTKYMPLAPGSKSVLGPASDALSRAEHPTNGWFAVQDSLLSDDHAEVSCHNGRIYIRNLDPTNATYINDTKISKSTALRSGDIIALGNIVARVVLSGNVISSY